jgi:hypothetical protein
VASSGAVLLLGQEVVVLVVVALVMLVFLTPNGVEGRRGLVLVDGVDWRCLHLLGLWAERGSAHVARCWWRGQDRCAVWLQQGCLRRCVLVVRSLLCAAVRTSTSTHAKEAAGSCGGVWCSTAGEVLGRC